LVVIADPRGYMVMGTGLSHPVRMSTRQIDAYMFQLGNHTGKRLILPKFQYHVKSTK
jgi:hypothetical protein